MRDVTLWHPDHATQMFHAVLAAVSGCYPPRIGRLLTRYSPVRHSVISLPPRRTSKKCFVRLECVKHAASVHPEPGSNSLKKFVQDQNLAWLIFYPVLFTLVLFFKNYILLNFQGYVTVQLSRFLSLLSLFRQLLDDITEVWICQELF